MADLWITGDNLFTHMRSLHTAPFLANLDESMRSQMKSDAPTTESYLKSMLVFTDHFCLVTSAGTIRDILQTVKSTEILPTSQVMLQLSIMIRNEMKGVNFLMIDGLGKGYWEEPLKGYDLEALDKFPDCMEDLLEGQRCFAVKRYTACVFHLMRGMEVIVRVMGDKLGAEVSHPNSDEIYPWGKIVGNMRTPIESMPKGPKKDDWWATQLMLHACNRAFRTKTAHPKRTYTENEAEDVVRSVRAYVAEVSELLS